MNTTVTLRDFQIEGVNLLKKNEEKYGVGSVLSFQMGLGKTLTMSYFLINQRLKELPNEPDLIVVPLCVLTQWRSEMLRLKSNLRIFIYHGPKRVELLKQIINNVDVVITTYYSFVTRELELYKWNRVVLDEAHTIRNGVQNRFKQLPKKVIGAYAMKSISKYRHCISGTPYNNRQDDVVSLMTFIGYDCSVTKFIEKFVIQKSKDDIMDPINTETIMVENPIGCDLSEYSQIYNLYVRILAMIQGTRNPVKLRDLTQQSVKLLARLRLYCDIMAVKNYVIAEEHIDSDDEDDEEEKNPKKYEEIEFSIEDKLRFYNSSIKIREVYNKIEKLIEKVPYKKIIVFSSFVTTIDILETITNHINPDIKTFQYIGKKNKAERDLIVEEFTEIDDDDTPMVLFATIGSGSCGLNLTPCSTVILVDVSMNPFDEFQAINRVHRITQTNQVNVYKFCMKDMIEEKIHMSHFFKIEDAKSVGLIIS